MDRRNVFIVIAMIALGAFYCSKVEGQSAYPIRYLGKKQGLSQSVNHFIYQDNKGLVWISAVDGLNCYNGRQVKVYRPNEKDPQAIKGTNVQSPFFEDSSGDIWFATEEAINCFRRKKGHFEYIKVAQQQVSDTTKIRYYAFYLEQNKYLWFLANDCVFKLNTQNPRDLPQLVVSGFSSIRCAVDTFEHGSVKQIFGASIWGTQNGFATLSFAEDGHFIGHQRYLEGAAAPTNFRINQIESGGNESAWLSTSKGLWYYKLGEKPVFYENKLEKDQFITVSANHSPQVLLVAYRSGAIYAFNKKNHIFELVVPAHPLNIDSKLEMPIEALYAKDGYIWWGARNDGVYFYYNALSPPFVTPLRSSVKQPIKRLFQLDEKTIWLSPKEGRLVVNLPQPAAHITRPDPYFYPKAIRGKNGKIWQISINGLHQYNPVHDGWDLKAFPNLCASYIDATLAQHDSLLFVGGIEGFIAINLTRFTTSHISKEIVYSLFTDAQGRIWQGGDAYIAVRQPVGAFEVIRKIDFQGDIICFWEDIPHSCIWVGGSNGLLKVNSNTLEKEWIITAQQGLPNQYIHAIVQDNKGVLWLSSNEGIIQFNPSQGPLAFKQYTTLDGLSSNEFNPGASMLDAQGRIWFGSTKGVDMFNPDSIKVAGKAPKLAITGLKIHDKPWEGEYAIDEMQHLVLPYDQNTLYFELAAMEYLDPEHNQFKVSFCRMEETPIWTDLGTQNFVTYANLLPGKYMFRYMACNAEGVCVDERDAKKMYIEIQPHWSNTTWFRLLLATGIVAFVALIVSFYYRYRLRTAQLKNEQQRHEAERQRLELENAKAIAESERKATESEIKLLRSQLNPHFLFNAMNSINRYILANESAKASEYLGQFAHLTRNILENSRSITISLADELAMLGHYIALESHRFEQKITWEFIISPSLDDEDVQVPSMFLQPFVENAILHGLAPKGGGHICVEIVEIDHSLRCSIRDNGVGRAVKSDKNTGIPKHASIGMRLISDRLSAFAHLEGGAATVEIHDLKDGDNNAAGTAVVILLPLKLSF